jgi:hypothetical protein
MTTDKKEVMNFKRISEKVVSQPEILWADSILPPHLFNTDNARLQPPHLICGIPKAKQARLFN